ncbi:MAG TPA: tripartite tricarboxylate transporter TctB family protein [Alphaproteobacteria bacterium]
MALRIDAQRGEAAVAVVLFLVGGFFAWQALALPMGSIGLPGPGFFPLVLGLALAAEALGLIVASGGLARGDAEATTELGHRDVVLTYVALLLVPVFFEQLGALATLGVFAAAVAMIVGRFAWWRAGLGAAIGMAAVWYFFKVLLGVQLPAGIF